MLLQYFSAVIPVVFIATGAASGEDVMKAVGDQVSFRPDKFVPPVFSILWKHNNSGGFIDKAILWREGDTETWIPLQRFKSITTLDVNTGQITITDLNFNHIGVYTIEINGKEQEQRFTLTVKEPVPKPVIKIEPTSDPNVVNLRCSGSGPGGIAGIIIVIILLIIAIIAVIVYKRNKKFKERVDGICPCINGLYDQPPSKTNGTGMESDKGKQEREALNTRGGDEGEGGGKR